MRVSRGGPRNRAGQQRDVRRHGGVGRDLGVRVGGADRALGRLVQVELAVVARVGQAHHPRGQVEVLVGAREWSTAMPGTKPSETVKTCWVGRVRVASTPGTGAPCGPGWSRPAGPGCCRCSGPGGPGTVGRHRRSARAARRCWRSRSSGVGQVVAAVDGGLDGEDVRRVAQVRLELAGHLRQRHEHVGEGRRVRLQDRVVRVGVVEGHLPRVGVDDHLDRVAHVVVAARAGCCRWPPAGC